LSTCCENLFWTRTAELKMILKTTEQVTELIKT